MSAHTIGGYKTAGDTLRMPDLRQALYDDGAILMDKVLVNLHGEEHRKRRNVEARVLRRDYFRWYETTVFPQTLKETFAPCLAAGKVDVVDFGFRAMMNLTADFAGIDRSKRTPDETAQLLRILRTFGKAATLGQAVGDKAAIRREIQDAIDEFDRDYFTPSTDRRRKLIGELNAGRISEDELPRDVLVELLRHETELELSRDVLLKEIGFYLLAGAFTSIHTMTHALHEILGWLEANPAEADQARSDRLFIQRCVHESTRLHPSSPTAGRRPTCPVTLPTGASAVPEDYISVDLMSANRDCTAFGADAVAYNPLRKVEKSQPPYGISFGLGAHACIGLNMAVGVQPRADTDPDKHQYGTVPLIIHALLQANARRDPNDPGVVDTSTIRNNWLRYPVLLAEARKWKEVLVSTVAGVSEVLRSPNLAQALYDDGAVIMDKVLLTLHGEEHRKRRILEFGVFRRDFFRWYETEIFPKTLNETIAEAIAAGRADLVELGYRVTMNLTADFAGIDRPARTARETQELLKLVMTFSEGATLVHSTRDKEEVRREVREALEKFDERFLVPSVKRRQAMLARQAAGEISDDDLPRDVLTVLLRNEDKLELPPDVLRREIAFYLQAGAHSTANSTTHALHEIFLWRDARPEDAERMRRDLLFLQRCVHESLRLHPASPVAWRKPVCPVQLANSGSVNVGDRVVVDLAAANRDPSVFGSNATEFDPHRSIPVGQLPFGLTFGTGVHSCLGRDLDGGVVPAPGAKAETHQYGIIALFVRQLLAEGARRDTDDPPTEATYTKRPNWGRYPIIFDRALRWTA